MKKILVVIGAKGTISKSFRKCLSNILAKQEIKELKKIKAMLVIHSFIMHSVNPYKVKQPIGYRTCHNTSVL
jgi:hypothetical protein